MTDVPLFASSLEPYHDRLSEALDRVARSGRYILGPEVDAFEEEFARYVEVRHCVGVANGTDALTIALRALGVGPGDEVVMPSFTFYATVEAALVLGAQAGALGDVATFSFFPSKNLPCLGDGGAITTNDDELAERIRILRFHGSRDKTTFTDVGWNSRLDELQAAALRVLLPELDGWIERRREAAAAYARLGLGDHVTLPAETEGARHAYHLYVVRSGRELPVGRGYYRTPVHRQPAIGADVELPGTEEAARTNWALPMGTGLTEDQLRQVVECVSGST
jgi:dTDP-4-amino-4,6-dideoxygalactose transaminase